MVIIFSMMWLMLLAVAEHRFIPAWVRNEWSRLKRRGIASVWSPAAPGIISCWSCCGWCGKPACSLPPPPLPCPLLLLLSCKSGHGKGGEVLAALGFQAVHACGWYKTALDIEECLAAAIDADVHLFVADVVKSFDTGYRGVLDCVLSSLGLPGWLRHVNCKCRANVRLQLKRACGLGELWTRDGRNSPRLPHECDVLCGLVCVPWCRHLDRLPA